jgi:hypothetical protein
MWQPRTDTICYSYSFIFYLLSGIYLFTTVTRVLLIPSLQPPSSILAKVPWLVAAQIYPSPCPPGLTPQSVWIGDWIVFRLLPRHYIGGRGYPGHYSCHRNVTELTEVHDLHILSISNFWDSSLPKIYCIHFLHCLHILTLWPFIAKNFLQYVHFTRYW